MARILFLAHRYPYPPNKGEKIRAFHIAEHLLKSHEVALGFTITPGDSEPDMSWARKFSDVHAGRISVLDRLLHTGLALPLGQSLSVAAFRDSGLQRWVHDYVAEKRPDVIFVFSSAMAQYVPRGIRTIIDFVDVDSEKWRQYAKTRASTRAWFYRLEADRLLTFDRVQATRAQAALFVSDEERRLFDRLSPETQDKHVGIANGVDIAHFDPARISPQPAKGPVIVFVGVMDYWPNVDAVSWFAKEILPQIRAKRSDALFQVVGARPTEAVLTLGALEGVQVTGAVDDVRPYLAGAAVVVAPLRIARGIQNKVLEGMAMARPVVTTPGALEGISALHGREVLVGETPQQLADAVLSVLDGRAPPTLGAAARTFVAANHDWAANLRRLDETIARAS